MARAGPVLEAWRWEAGTVAGSEMGVWRQGRFFSLKREGLECAGCWREGSGGRCHGDGRGLPRSWRERAGPGRAGGEGRGGADSCAARQEGEGMAGGELGEAPACPEVNRPPFSTSPTPTPNHPAPGEMTYPCDNLTGCVSTVGRRLEGHLSSETYKFQHRALLSGGVGPRVPGAAGLGQHRDSQTGGSRCRVQGAGGG